MVILLAAVVAFLLGVRAYRQMDDRKGVPLREDLLAAIRNEPLPPVVEPAHLNGSTPPGPPPGLLIAFEGGEGSGKTTQARLVAIWLRELGYDVVTTHEPGATKIGMRLRALLLDTSHTGMSPHAEALMYAADRAEHVASVIAPALARGAIVITDRYVDSSLAYQGAGRDLPVDEIARFNWWATGGRTPDLTILLDMDPMAGLSRRARSADRLEAEPADFHLRVRARLPGPGPRRTRPLPGARRRPVARRDHPRHPGPDPRAAPRPGALGRRGQHRGLPRDQGRGPDPRPRARPPASLVTGVFGDLPGQDAVVAQLRRAAAGAAAVLAGRPPEPGAMTHAWLFTGPPGSGRSVAARAFAAALLCPSGGCGECASCRQVFAGTHADLLLVRPEGLSYGVKQTRDLVLRAAGKPTGGPLADRPVRGRRPVHGTGRQRPAQGDRGARAADGLAAVRALGRGHGAHDQVAVPGGHAGRAVVGRGRPGTDRAGRHRARSRAGRGPRGAGAHRPGPASGHRCLGRQAPGRRAAGPAAVTSLGPALAAAAALVRTAEEEAKAVTEDLDEPEREALRRAFGEGSSGKGVAKAMRGMAGAMKDLEDRQKSRATRVKRDTLDQALLELALFYRDVLMMQLGAEVELANAEADLRKLAASSTPEATLRRLQAIMRCRERLTLNVAPLLAVEEMTLSLAARLTPPHRPPPPACSPPSRHPPPRPPHQRPPAPAPPPAPLRTPPPPRTRTIPPISTHGGCRTNGQPTRSLRVKTHSLDRTLVQGMVRMGRGGRLRTTLQGIPDPLRHLAGSRRSSRGEKCSTMMPAAAIRS